RLVNDPLHIQPGNLPGLLGGLALSIIEIRRHRDHSFRYRRTEIILGGSLHLLQDHRRNLLRGIQTITDAYTYRVVIPTLNLVGDHLHFSRHIVVLLAHKALDRLNRVLRVRDSLAFCRVTHFAFTFPIIEKRNHRWGGPSSLAIGNHNGFVTLHDRHAGVGST